MRTTGMFRVFIMMTLLLGAPVIARADCGFVFSRVLDIRPELIPGKFEDLFSIRIREPEFPGRFEEVTAGKVFRGPLPTSDAHMEFLKSKGVKKIFSLIEHEGDIAGEAVLASRHGIEVEFLRIPNFLTRPDRDLVLRVVAELGQAARGEAVPVYLHCRRGKDRTGLFIGLHEVLNEGKDPHRVYTHMRDVGFSPALRPLLQIWTEVTGYNPIESVWLDWWSAPLVPYAPKQSPE